MACSGVHSDAHQRGAQHTRHGGPSGLRAAIDAVLPHAGSPKSRCSRTAGRAARRPATRHPPAAPRVSSRRATTGGGLPGALSEISRGWVGASLNDSLGGDVATGMGDGTVECPPETTFPRLSSGFPAGAPPHEPDSRLVRRRPGRAPGVRRRLPAHFLTGLRPAPGLSQGISLPSAAVDAPDQGAIAARPGACYPISLRSDLARRRRRTRLGTCTGANLYVQRVCDWRDVPVSSELRLRKS